MDYAPHHVWQMFLALPLNTVQLFSPLFLDRYLISSLFEILDINVSVNDILIGPTLCNHFGKWVNHQRVTPGNIVGLCIACRTHAGNIDWKQIISIVILPIISMSYFKKENEYFPCCGLISKIGKMVSISSDNNS